MAIDFLAQNSSHRDDDSNDKSKKRKEEKENFVEWSKPKEDLYLDKKSNSLHLEKERKKEKSRGENSLIKPEKKSDLDEFKRHHMSKFSIGEEKLEKSRKELLQLINDTEAEESNNTRTEHLKETKKKKKSFFSRLLASFVGKKKKKAKNLDLLKKVDTKISDKIKEKKSAEKIESKNKKREEALAKEKVIKEKERLEKIKKEEALKKAHDEKEKDEEEKRLKLEKEEKDRKERLEKERLEKERLEKERLEKERLEKERLEKEQKKIEKNKLAHKQEKTSVKGKVSFLKWFFDLFKSEKKVKPNLKIKFDKPTTKEQEPKKIHVEKNVKKEASNVPVNKLKEIKNKKSFFSLILSIFKKDKKNIKLDLLHGDKKLDKKSFSTLVSKEREEDVRDDEKKKKEDDKQEHGEKDGYKKKEKDNQTSDKRFDSPLSDKEWASSSVLKTNLIRNEILIFFDWKKNFIISIVFVFLACSIIWGSYYGLVWWENEEKIKNENFISKLNSINLKINNAEKSVNNALEFKQHVGLVRELIDNHVYWTNLFKFLEENTLENARYLEFSGDDSGEYSLEARVESYSAIDAQVEEFLKKEYVLDAVVNEGELILAKTDEEENGVAIKLNIIFDKKIFTDYK